jgi:hypothetical protein
MRVPPSEKGTPACRARLPCARSGPARWPGRIARECPSSILQRRWRTSWQIVFQVVSERTLAPGHRARTSAGTSAGTELVARCGRDGPGPPPRSRRCRRRASRSRADGQTPSGRHASCSGSERAGRAGRHPLWAGLRRPPLRPRRGRHTVLRVLNTPEPLPKPAQGGSLDGARAVSSLLGAWSSPRAHRLRAGATHVAWENDGDVAVQAALAGRCACRYRSSTNCDMTSQLRQPIA